MRRASLLIAAATFALLQASCSDDSAPPPGDGAVAEAGGDGPAGDGPADGPVLDAPTGNEAAVTEAGSSDGWNPNNQPGCSGTIYACSDGTDNDGDGLTDAQDPECIGPCDNDEGSFETGIPGDNSDPCKQDCFFDGDSGSGTDKCLWNHKCDPLSPSANLSPACPYDPNYNSCDPAQPTICLEVCLPVTPNGCDCFGCCQIFSGGQSYIVYLGSGSSCTAATPDNCAPCTQVPSCLNECGECELCLGRTIDDLPESCFSSVGDSGAPQLPECQDGRTPCLSNANCEESFYCITGCCIPGID